MSKNEEFELIINEMELNVYNYKELQDYRKRLENIQEKSKDKSVYEINDKITFEILFLYYRVQDGKLVPFFSNEDYYFPDFSRFNDECVIYLDYRFKNTTQYPIQIRVWLDDTFLYGEIRCNTPLNEKYKITEEDNHFAKDKEGVYYRNSKVYRIITDKQTNKEIRKELILDNHSKVMYDYELIPKEQIRAV